MFFRENICLYFVFCFENNHSFVHLHKASFLYTDFLDLTVVSGTNEELYLHGFDRVQRFIGLDFLTWLEINRFDCAGLAYNQEMSSKSSSLSSPSFQRSVLLHLRLSHHHHRARSDHNKVQGHHHHGLRLCHRHGLCLHLLFIFSDIISISRLLSSLF